METLPVGSQNTARMKQEKFHISIVNPGGKRLTMPKMQKTGSTNHFSAKKSRKTT